MTKIAISLAAVLLLIVVIGYFAMRFLRADDTDEFDDLPAEPFRSRGRPADQGRASGRRATATASRPGRGARGFPDTDAASREQDQPARRRSARPVSGGFAAAGPDAAGYGPGSPDTGGYDTGGYRTGGVPDAGRGRISREFAVNRAGRAGDQAPDDRGYGDRRFSFNPRDVDDLDAGGYGSGTPPDARGWAASDAESTQVLGADRRPDQDRRDRDRASTRSSPGTRSGRARRTGEMSGKDWDSLSDVDYWAELSSDKSLAATAGPDFAQPSSAPAASRSERRSRSRGTDAALADGSAPRNDRTLAGDVTAVMPVRRHAAAGPPATPLLPGDSDVRGGLAAPGHPGDRGLLADGPPARGGASGHGSRRSRELPASPRDLPAAPLDLPAAPYGGARARAPQPAAPDPDGSIAALARPGGPQASGSQPPRLDDDPLTSPSFPAIRDEDSRSYRSRGSGGYDSGGYDSGGYSSGGYLPAAPAGGYPAAPAPAAGFDDLPSERGRRGRRARPGDYPAPAGPPATAPAARHRDYSDGPATAGGPPAGNPYGSYVSPAGSPPEPPRPDNDANGRYGASQDSQRYSQPSGRHLGPPPLGYPGPSQPASGYAAPGIPAGDYARAGETAPGYPVPGYSSGTPAVPMYAAPVPADPEPAPGAYGRSRPASSPAPARADEPYGPPAASYQPDGYPGGRYQPDGYPAGGYPAPGGYGEPDYPAAAYSGRQYDQSAYLPEATPGGQRDQNGYGSPDAGYGADAHDGYPGY